MSSESKISMTLSNIQKQLAEINEKLGQINNENKQSMENLKDFITGVVETKLAECKQTSAVVEEKVKPAARKSTKSNESGPINAKLYMKFIVDKKDIYGPQYAELCGFLKSNGLWDLAIENLTGSKKPITEQNIVITCWDLTKNDPAIRKVLKNQHDKFKDASKKNTADMESEKSSVADMKISELLTDKPIKAPRPTSEKIKDSAKKSKKPGKDETIYTDDEINQLTDLDLGDDQRASSSSDSD